MRANCARGRFFQTGDEVEQGALATTGGTQKNDELAGLDLEIYIGQRLVRPRAPRIPDLANINAANRCGRSVRSREITHCPVPLGLWGARTRLGFEQPKSKVEREAEQSDDDDGEIDEPQG